MADYKYLIFITVVGSENVGKKTLAKSKFLDHFSDLDYMLTTGVELSSKTVEINETIVKLLFRIFSCKQYWWNKTGKVNLEILVRNSHGAIILYDITKLKSIEQIPHWIQIVRDNAGDIPIVLAGTKADLNKQRKISKEQIETIKNKHNIATILDISAKTGENVENLILNLTRLILKKLNIR